MSDERRFPRWVYGTGSDPDARFSLANERTFLAWIRTSLALLAGGVALEALRVGFQPQLRLAASILLTVAGIARSCGASRTPSAPSPLRAWPTTRYSSTTSTDLNRQPVSSRGESLERSRHDGTKANISLATASYGFQRSRLTATSLMAVERCV